MKVPPGVTAGYMLHYRPFLKENPSPEDHYMVLPSSDGKEELLVFHLFEDEIYNNDLWAYARNKRPDLIYIAITGPINPDFHKRLLYVAKYEVVVPVFVSSFCPEVNVCGCIWPFDHHVSKKKQDAGIKNANDIYTFRDRLPGELDVVEYDFNRVRHLLGDKFKFKEACGTWPPDEIFTLTMFAKIYRIERKKLRYMAEQDAFLNAFA